MMAELALQSVITTTGTSEDPIAILSSLRVTFGCRPSPFLVAELSESTADLANAFAHCKLWDPIVISPSQSTLIGYSKLESGDVPFTQARAMSVDLKANEFGTVEVYLDDLISAFPALSVDHVRQGSLASLLFMEVTSRPIASTATQS